MRRLPRPVTLGEREALVAAAIQRLPVIFREILELQDSTDYSIIQIAEALGISVAAANPG